MTSVVTDLLDSAGVLVKDDIPSKVGRCRQNMERIKVEVQEMLTSRYINFIPQYLKLDKIFASLETAKSEYEVLHYHVEKEIKPQMSASVTEYHETFADMEKIEALRKAIKDLIKMHNYLTALKKTLLQNQYLDAVQNVLAFQEEFSQLSTEIQKDVDIVCAMKSDFYFSKVKLIQRLLERWQERVSITQHVGTKKFLSRSELSLVVEPANEFRDIISSLEKLHELESVLKPFGKEFLDAMCKPIMLHDTEVKKLDSGNKTRIVMTVLRKERQHPTVVFQRLTEVFSNMSILPFTWSSSNTDKNSSVIDLTLAMKFSDMMTADFCNLVIENCLKPAIPSTSTELDSFQSAICGAVNFHNTLVEAGFLNDVNPLQQFIQNVDDLPANKMSSDLLNRARELMKQDLHQTVSIHSDDQLMSPSNQQQTTTDLNDMVCNQNCLSKASFAFPACHISVFARDLVIMLQQVMDEAKKLETQSSTNSLNLYCSARSICELYCCVVPTYHKEAITNIPQQTAIHHNNCMYIAHCLLTLGLSRDPSKSLMLGTFVDLVPELRKLGTEAFLAQMIVQRQHILQLLKAPEAFRTMTQDNESLSKSEKTMRQCLQQLEFLKRVWSDILPLEVYFKAMGTLLNTLLEEIIACLVAMEDIAAQTAAQLDSVFSTILKQSPELFKVSRGDKSDVVHKYVKRWFKFQELQYVLNFNLSEIVDRWANGDGPLASHFSPDEMKHFIRALFQNTERRAAALRKIK